MWYSGPAWEHLNLATKSNCMLSCFRTLLLQLESTRSCLWSILFHSFMSGLLDLRALIPNSEQRCCLVICWWLFSPCPFFSALLSSSHKGPGPFSSSLWCYHEVFCSKGGAKCTWLQFWSSFLKPFVIPLCRFANFHLTRPQHVAYFLQGRLRCISIISIPLVVLEMVTNL